MKFLGTLAIISFFFIEALRNILGGLNDPKTYLHTPVGNSTRLPIEIVIYSYAGPEKVVATLKLLLEFGLDVNFVKKNSKRTWCDLLNSLNLCFQNQRLIHRSR
jgi:hypothetical protein